MSVENEILEQTSTQEDEVKYLKIIVVGNEKDVLLENKLKEWGHEMSFVNIPEAADGESTNFTYKDLLPGITLGKEQEADLVIATDRATNKICVAVPKKVGGNFQILNAHQLAALFTHQSIGTTAANDTSFKLIKSIHISDLVENIATKKGGKSVSMVIAPGALEEKLENNIDEADGDETVIGLTENQELISNKQDFYEIIASILSFEQELRKESKTMFDQLLELYSKHGFYKEKTFTVKFYSKNQKTHLTQKMDEIRTNPRTLDGRFSVTRMTDYRKGTSLNYLTQKKTTIDEPKADILKLEAADNTSLTFVLAEDKMCYHISTKAMLLSKENFEAESRVVDEQIIKLIQVINKL